MKTNYSLTTITPNRSTTFTRLIFLTGTSIALMCNTLMAQGTVMDATADKSTAANSEDIANYRHISSLTTGASYKYNITQFVAAVLRTDAVEYTERASSKMIRWANSLAKSANNLAANAKELRIEAGQAKEKKEAIALSKKADSLDELSDLKKLEATKNAINATENQYDANAEEIKIWQKSYNYSSDVLTSADLLNNEANYYYSKSITEVQKADTTQRVYLKQGFADAAKQDMEIAVMKQQGAQNIYLSLNQDASISIAEKIDSILSSAPTPAMPKAEPMSFGHVVFCVQVGAYSNSVPLPQANKLLKLSQMGITRHMAGNGIITYTVGEFPNFNGASDLTKKLVAEGFPQSFIVTYNSSENEQQEATRWVLAQK